MRNRQYSNKVLDKALQIIDALGYPEYTEMGIDDLSATLKLPKGTIMPYLGSFERAQWLEQTQETKWRIAPKLSRLAEGCRKHFAGRRTEVDMLEREHLGEIHP